MNRNAARKAALLRLFEQQGGRNLRRAAGRLGVHRASVYRWAEADPTFAADLARIAHEQAQRRYQTWKAGYDAQRAAWLAEQRQAMQARAAYARSCRFCLTMRF